MKILILAAGKNNNPQSPSCFNLTIGAVTLLEYHLRILTLMGFKKNQIYIITDKKETKEINLDAQFIKVSNNNQKSFYSVKYYIDNFWDSENLLIINGNAFFEIKDLEKLINNLSKSKILLEKRNSLYTKGLNLEEKDDNIIKVSDKTPEMLPWFSYYGAIFLTQSDILQIKSFREICNMPYLQVIINKIGLRLQKIDVNAEANHIKSTELIGGSFAGLSKLNTVKKYADLEGNDKLIMEIEWLKNLPNNLKDKFPTVIDYKITPSESWFTMPFYDLENLRKKIISGKFLSSKTLYFIEKILNYLFDNVYINRISVASDNWVEKKHFERFYMRLMRIQHIEPFNKILLSKYIIINGQRYLNLKYLIDILHNYQNQTKLFNPNELVMIHGDLHFQNMLIDERKCDFILADPRGELNGSDIYYDFGKLWHSFNGLYDLIHTDISETSMLYTNQEESSFSLKLGNGDLLSIYQQIKNDVEKLILNYPIAKDPDFKLKIHFAEVMHFSSLMWFHLKHDKTENRALCLYLQAIRLANDLLKNLGLFHEQY